MLAIVCKYVEGMAATCDVFSFLYAKDKALVPIIERESR